MAGAYDARANTIPRPGTVFVKQMSPSAYAGRVKTIQGACGH
jgi:hypothetical protein